MLHASGARYPVMASGVASGPRNTLCPASIPIKMAVVDIRRGLVPLPSSIAIPDTLFEWLPVEVERRQL